MSETRVPSPEELQRLKEANVRRMMNKRYFKRNTVLGIALAAGVVGIYSYSMLAVKQETFLDGAFDQKPAGSPPKKD